MKDVVTLLQKIGLGMRKLDAEGVPFDEAAERVMTAAGRAVDEYVERLPLTEAQKGKHALILILPLAGLLGTAWSETSFATVELGAKLAASLAATSIPPEYAANVVMPFRIVRIVVPPGVLDEDEASILVARLDDGRFFTLAMTSLQGGHQQFGSLADFLRYRARAEALPADMRTDRWVPFERVSELLHQIAVGTMIELDQRGKSAEPPAPRPGAPPAVDARGNPRVWTFKLTRPVKVDVRPAIRAYVAGGGRSPTVQLLVRGHHRRVRTGPGRAEVRWAQVEPYWRGPEDAPVALRPHRLRDGRRLRRRR